MGNTIKDHLKSEQLIKDKGIYSTISVAKTNKGANTFICP